MTRERIKNAIIAILFVSSIVLMSIRFELVASSVSNTPASFDELGVESTLKTLVRPTSIVVRYTSNNITKVVDKEGFYYQEARSVLFDSLKEISAVNEITMSEYNERKKSKSIQLDFDPGIDQRLLYGSLFFNDGNFGDFNRIHEILIPLGSDTSIYMLTDIGYLKFKNTHINYMSYVDNLAAINHNKYYSLEELFDSTSQVLISDTGIELSPYSTISSFGDNLESVIRSIFGSRYDFASRISELDGTNIISYDYGRELLKIEPDGNVIYLNQDALSNPVRTSMADNLVVAYSFLDKLNPSSIAYTVDNVFTFSENAANGYTFYFAPRIDGFKGDVHSQNKIKITVTNGRIYSFEGIVRTIPEFLVDNEDTFGMSRFAAPTQGLNALEILDLNYDYIKSKVNFVSSLDLFNMISLIEVVYALDSEFNYAPSYKLIIKGQTFYFNTNNGEVVSLGLE